MNSLAPQDLAPARGSYLQNLYGIPVSQVFDNPWQARQMFDEMSVRYPGELFNLEFTGQDDGAVVTWIPSTFVGSFLGQALASSATAARWWSESF
jgi:hypothetical protein